ncbi:hypothetical protein [Nannocystis pusilla]|uniref:hypothetical protein n=1 Tax=Nannocystis pusilla TaxID=889268 RepID=UPI003DA4BB1F
MTVGTSSGELLPKGHVLKNMLFQSPEWRRALPLAEQRLLVRSVGGLGDLSSFVE